MLRSCFSCHRQGTFQRQTEPRLARLSVPGRSMESVHAYVGDRPTLMVAPSGETFRASMRTVGMARKASSLVLIAPERSLAGFAGRSCGVAVECSTFGCRVVYRCGKGAKVGISPLPVQTQKQRRLNGCCSKCNIRCLVKQTNSYTDLPGPLFNYPALDPQKPRDRRICQERCRVDTGVHIEAMRDELDEAGYRNCSAKHCRVVGCPSAGNEQAA